LISNLDNYVTFVLYLWWTTYYKYSMKTSSMNYPILLRLLFSFFFILTINTSSNAQEEKLIQPKKLIKDFETFERFIDAHPDPFTHISENNFNKKLDEVKLSLDVPHTQLEFYKKISSIVALIKDGHSSVHFSEFWMEKKKKEFGCFPYKMHLSNENELFVLENFNNGKMEPGAKVVAINDISVDSFLNKIDPFISYEKQVFRNTIIDDDIDKYLHLAFSRAHDLKFTYVQLDTLETTVENMPFKEWKKFQKDDREEKEQLIAQGKPYSYEKVKDGIGKLNIYGFYAANFTTYNQFLLKTFKTIRKDSIHSLIIDIRGNYGGWPKIASELFHYISEGYFKTMAKSSMKVSYPYRNYFFDRYPSLRTNSSAIPKRRHFVDLGAIMNQKIGTFKDEDFFFNEEPITETFEFQGDVYLLTNRDSYSAASSFASTFQCYRMGLIIGEETGGTKIFRANPIWKKLDNSNILVRLSTTKLYTACYSEELEGVKPTVKYIPSIFELLSDLDTQMIYAQRVIKKVRKKRAAEEIEGESKSK